MRRTFPVPTIKPFDLYDFSRAKIACNLGWLMAQAFGTENIPEDIKDPIFTDQFDQDHVKPPVVSLLLSGELYCRAGSRILKSGTAKTLLGHDAVIYALGQKGLYIIDQERLITQRDLLKKPIRMSAHLAMIDTLMMAYTVEMVSIKKVIACAQKYSNFFQDADLLPYDIESAVTYWVNKVNEHLKDIVEQEEISKEHHTGEAPGGEKAPYRKEQTSQTSLKHLSCVSLVENLLKDGCALAALIHFYCPGVVSLEDIRLDETMSLADSLHNLQLIREFCQEYLNGCCHFSLEDMLYASSAIKSNCLAFMAELFWWFEVVKPSFVQPRVVRPQGVEHGKDTPSVPVLNAAKRNIVDGSSISDFTSRCECLQAHPSTSEEIRSSSMPYVESILGTRPKKKRRAHGVSFDISSDEEDNTQSSSPHQSITYYVGNKGLTLNNRHASKRTKKKLSLRPSDGEGMEEERPVDPRGDFKFYISVNRNELNSEENTPHRLLNEAFQNTVLLDEFGKQIETQDIEEALQLIHAIENSPYAPELERIINDFSRHSQGLSILNSNIKLDHSSPDNVTDKKSALSPKTDTVKVDTGIRVPPEDLQKTTGKGSSLRGYTIGLDSHVDDASKCHRVCDIRGRNPTEALSPCPHIISTKAEPRSSASSSYGARRARLSRHKFRKLSHTVGSSSQKTPPERFERNIPLAVSSTQMPEAATISRIQDSAQQMAFDIMHLQERLEKMRCDIESYKKKVKAIFTKERLKRKRKGYLTAVKKKGDGTSPLQDKIAASEDEKMYTDQEKEKESQQSKRQNSKSLPDIKESMENPQSKGPKSPTTPVDPKKQENLARPSGETDNERDVFKYMKSIENLSSSLNFLQQELKRPFLKQDMLVKMRKHESWVTSPSQPSPQKQIRDFKSRQAGLSAATAPFSAHSPRSTHPYPTPQSSSRKYLFFSGKNQRTLRPNELKVTPLNRTMTPPQSVDSLPRIRRVSPSQVPTPTGSFVRFDDDGEYQLRDSKTKEEIKKESFESKGTLEPRNRNPRGKKIKPLESTISEILSQPFSETVCAIPNKGLLNQRTGPPTKSVFAPPAPKSVNLIQVSPSHLKLPEKADVSVKKYDGESDKEQFGDDRNVCCGFFFKDDLKAESDMATKRAALLKNQLRREKETQLWKQELEAEMEQKKEEAWHKTEKEHQKKDERVHRAFISQEYLRRKQANLMEDMDTTVKPLPQVGKQKKQRPVSIHGGHSEAPKTPIKGPPVSRLSLALPNTGAKESTHPVNRASRPESVESFSSLSRCSSQNVIKDWGNASTASSEASATEYTRPKLYEEPTTKSNKLIIRNALAQFCLPGRVNEVRKKKILEEMEKTDAQNFLILFRDSGYDFRSLYTYCPETEEINKLTGIGPKSVTKKMIMGLYKYNSDRKLFSQILSKTLSASVDAITIQGHVWQIKRPSTTKKLLPTKE